MFLTIIVFTNILFFEFNIICKTKCFLPTLLGIEGYWPAGRQLPLNLKAEKFLRPIAKWQYSTEVIDLNSSQIIA